MGEPWHASTGLPPAVTLRRLIFGHRVAQIIATAAQLGIADHMGNMKMSAAELATLVHAEEHALRRLLRALASIAVLSEEEDGRFSLTPLGACLQTDAPGSMRSWALFEAAEHFQRSWSDLLYSVQTGAPAVAHVFGVDVDAFMKQHPDVERSFSQAMGASAMLAADAVVEAYDFPQAQQIVDVGGGHGILLAAILQRRPALRGVLFDVPAVVERATQRLDAAGLTGRYEVVGGDFLLDVPTHGDVYILSRVLMGYEDDGCVRILRNCHKAMDAHGRVLIIQQLMPPAGSGTSREMLFEGSMSDLNMLVMTGGHERTEAEYHGLLEAAGFRVTQTVPTRSLMSIVEGTKT